MNRPSGAPFYQKLSLNLLTLALITVGLSLAKDIILPFLFSILLANILLPLIHYLIKIKFNKSIAILLPLVLTIIIGGSLLYFLSSQVMNFLDDVPALKVRVNEVSHSFQVWFRQTTAITIREQNKYITDTVSDLKDDGLFGFTFTSLTGILSYLVLMPVYTFLLLYYRSTIKDFLIHVFKNGSELRVSEVLTQSTKVAQQYLTGLLIETLLVFTMNTIGFLILGVKYAIFLALLAALLNLIPYIGILIANVICMFITLASSNEISHVIWVGIILAAVQLWDNNFGMPLIVGNKVRINALVTIIGVLVGGALCGIPGMFLAIPGLAVLKVIFDKVPELTPWGALLGDNSPTTLITKIEDNIDEGEVKP
jgi:predicted PurR-regulated permease PerM